METTFLLIFILLSILGLIVKIVLNTVNSKYIRQHRNKVPADFSEKIDLASHQKAADYSTHKLKFNNFSLIYNTVFLYAYLFLGIKAIDELLTILNLGSELLNGALFFAASSLLSFVFGLPLELYSTFIIEEKFGFNKMTPKLYILDTFKMMLISALIGLPLALVILKLMQVSGNNWWVFAASTFVLFQFFLLWAYPKFIAPLFNKFTPLEDAKLKGELSSLRAYPKTSACRKAIMAKVKWHKAS